jgi:hypothetical protein
VTLSDYQGGASIGSFLCRRAGDRGIEYVGLYAFVPYYDFSDSSQSDSAIRIENDTIAWLGVMRRINYMLKTGFDLSDLEKKNRRLLELIDSKIDDMENSKPQLGVRDYLQRISENFNEVPFSPLDDVWEKNIGQLLNDLDEDEDSEDVPDE